MFHEIPVPPPIEYVRGSQGLKSIGATMRAFERRDDLFLSKGRIAMSNQPQQPPLRPGNRVRYSRDPGHIETVETCEWIAEAMPPHWRVTSSWSGGRRVADAAEFVSDGETQ